MEFTFRGSILLVYLIAPAGAFEDGIPIRDPEFCDIKGRMFLVGTVPSSTNDWASGQRIGVAFDQVAHYLEFQNEDEFISGFNLYDNHGGRN